MFHVTDAHNGRGILTVKDGNMMIHVSLSSKGIKNLYLGTAEKAKTDSENWLFPTKDKVTFNDGLSETVNGYDIPIKVLNKRFSLALIGKKGVWYDHDVWVWDAKPLAD